MHNNWRFIDISLTVQNISAQIQQLDNSHIYGSLDNEIFDVRPYSEREKMKRGILYIAGSICQDTCNPIFNIAIVHSLEVDKVIEEVSDMLYKDYHLTAAFLRLNKAAADNSAGNDLANICYEILENPVWIFNHQMALLGVSANNVSRYPSPYVHKGSCLRINTSPEIQEADRNCPFRRIVGKISKDDTVKGYLVMADLKNSYETDGKKAHFDHICSILSLYEQFNYTVSLKSQAQEFITDLIEGKITDPLIVQQNANHLRFTQYEKYYILAIWRTEQELQNPIQAQIARLLNKTIYSYHQYYVIILGCSFTQRLDVRDFPELTNLLIRYRMYAGLSNGFSSLSQLKNAFEQSIGCLSIKSLYTSQDMPFIRFEDRFIPYLMKCAEKCGISLISLCKPAITEILTYDNENNTDYFKTLTAYLFNRMSIQAAADKLYMHRNTVYKRIVWMKDNYSLNFQSQYEIIKLQLSILIIGYLGLMELDPLVEREMDSEK